jgi:hypothetical protein
MTESGWQQRVAALSADQVKELARRLDTDLLGGWLLVEGEVDYNIGHEELAGLLEAALDQHEQDDIDEHGEGGRRAADLRRLGSHLDSVEAKRSPAVEVGD